MPLKIIRQDITKIKCDAIVNPTDPHYAHGGGTDAAIHAEWLNALKKRTYIEDMCKRAAKQWESVRE